MSATIELPRLLGPRQGAVEAVEAAALPDRLDGAAVVVMGAAVAVISSVYADELVEQTPVRRGAREIVVVGWSPLLLGQLDGAATRRGIRGAVRPALACDAGV